MAVPLVAIISPTCQRAALLRHTMESRLPVVATAVGGLLRRREHDGGARSWDGVGGYPDDEATGVVVSPDEAEGISRAAGWLLADLELRSI